MPPRRNGDGAAGGAGADDEPGRRAATDTITRAVKRSKLKHIDCRFEWVKASATPTS